MAKPQSFKPNDPRINRNGAPPKEWTMASLIREAAEEEDETGTPKKLIIARKLVTLAAKGDMVALKELNNRLDGMPVQKNVHSGDDDEPIKIVITKEKTPTDE